MSKTTCVNECPSGQFLKLSFDHKICDECSDSCLNCVNSSENCTACKSGFFLKEKQCLRDCPNGTWTDKMTLKCRECEQGCASCSENGKDCFYCNESFFLINGYCSSKCPLGYWEDSFERKCKECDKTCSSCRGSGSHCETCHIGNFFHYDSCLKSCPLGFKDNKYDQTCTKCHLGYFEKYEEGVYENCEICDQKCKTCIKNQTYCTSCKQDLFAFQGECVTECPEHYFPNKDLSKCMGCHHECKNCFDSGNTMCTSCEFGLFLLEGTCLKKCPDRYYADLNRSQCLPCHFSCKKCLSEREEECLDDCFETRLFHEKNKTVSNLSLGKCICKSGFYEALGRDCIG